MRGAYHPFEVSAHASRMLANSEGKGVGGGEVTLLSPSISPELLSPVWENKEETDENYNKCTTMLIKRVAREVAQIRRDRDRGQLAIPRLGVLFGTHNLESCEHILDALVQEGLATRSHEDGAEVTQIDDEAAECITLGQLYGA